MQWGNYRLEVYDPATGAASSMRFHAGWSAKPGSGESPDRLQVVSDKASYKAGETAQIQLRAPFAGEVLVAIATDRVLDTRVVSIPAEGKVIEIEVDPEWGAGAYVLASAFRPGKEQERGPGRAVGVSWLAVDAAPRTIQVQMQVPDKVLPRQKVEIPVTLSNLSGAHRVPHRRGGRRRHPARSPTSRARIRSTISSARSDCRSSCAISMAS